MNRQSIIEKLTDGTESTESEIKEVVDFFEEQFNIIRDKLATVKIGEFDRIDECYDLAENLSTALY